MSESAARTIVAGYALGRRVEDAAATETFLAEDLSLGRPVWFKRAKRDVERAGETATELEAEARRFGKVQHPTLTELVAYLPDERAIVYAEPGVARLHELVGRVNRLDPTTVIAIASEVARGLAALHAAGFVHGWLRAEHVELGAGGTVRLHGWGCSPFATPSRPPIESSLDPPENLAPEQVLGDATDERSDVFLLGSLAFSALTGRRPFGGEGGVVHRLRHEPAPLLRTLVHDAPPELEALLARCLDRRPSHRPDILSAACELGAALRLRTLLPTEVIIRRALGRAGFVALGALPRGVDEGAPRNRWRASWIATLAVVGAAAVAVVLAVATGRGGGTSQAPARLPGQQPARVRVLAEPWAEVDVDGRYVDTTPIGWPIELAPGRHVVRFHHPAAPDETRVVNLAAGQTQLLDVTMAVRTATPDAAPSRVPPDEEQP